MYTVFTRKVDDDVAAELADYIASAIIAKAQEGTAFTGEHKFFSKECLIYRPDYQSGDNAVGYVTLHQLRLVGEAGSGTHSLDINMYSGELMVTHNGARKSYPGNAFDLLPESWWKINDIKHWKMSEYRTSQPKWAAVAGFLKGQQGEGPANQEEADSLVSQKKLKELQKMAFAVGRILPESIEFHVPSGKYWDNDKGEIFNPNWTGPEYRRARANGVKLKR